MLLDIESPNVAYAVLSTLGLEKGCKKSKKPEESRIVALLQELKGSELQILANRGVVKIQIDDQSKLSAEIAQAQKIAKHKRDISRLVEKGAPYEMMRLFGISERRFTHLRKSMGIAATNQNRPKQPDNSDIEKIEHVIHFLKESDYEVALLEMAKQSRVSLSKIWQVVRGLPEIQTRLGKTEPLVHQKK